MHETKRLAKRHPLLRALLRALFPFGWSNIAKLALAYFFSTLYFYIPVGTLYLQAKDLNYVQINSLWGIIVFTMFLTEVPTGVVADRIGRTRAIQMALGLQLLGEVIYIFARGYAGFVLAAIAGGLGFAFGSGCIEALAYDALDPDRRDAEMSKAMGYIEAAQRLANLLAFAVGGLLVSTLTQDRFVTAIVATACMVGIGLLISFALVEPPAERQAPGQAGSLQLLQDGINLLRHNKLFRRLALLSLATIPFRDYLGSLYQPHFVDAGVPPVLFGLALSLASGLSILGARYAYLIEAALGASVSLLLVTALPGALYLTMATVSHPAFSVVAFCTLYGSMSLKSPILAGQLNRHIESENRATVLSMISMASGVYVSLMGLLIGRIADTYVPYAFLSMGLVVLAGALIFRAKKENRHCYREGKAQP